MRSRGRAALAGVLVMSGPLLVGQVSVAPAGAVAQVAQAPGEKPDKAGKGSDDDKRKGRNEGRDKSRDKGRDKGSGKGRDGRDGAGNGPRRDRTAPATPALSAPRVGPRGAVWLTVSAENGATVVASEVGGRVVAIGTGTGGYASLWWRTSHGNHSYAVTATDSAGNRSRAATTSVFVDARPPRVTGVALTPGSPSDTRTRLRFTTDAGSAFRVLAAGRQVQAGRAAGPRVERFLDLPDGRWRVQVVVRDAIGNARTATRPVRIRIPELSIDARAVGDPTERTQAVRVRATPTATRGVLRLPDRAPVAFVVRRGAATVQVDLPDGTYRRGTVAVRDTQGRTGRTRLPALTVDTVPPEVGVAPDEEAAAEGLLQAAVTAEDDATVRWRLLDRSGAVVTSGELAVEDGASTLTADVEEGRYQLVAAATDAFDRTTTVETSIAVAADPTPLWLVLLRGAALAVAALLAAVGLVLLLRWARRPDSPVRPALGASRRALVRLRDTLGPVPDGQAAGAGIALFDTDLEGPRIPAPRSPGPRRPSSATAAGAAATGSGSGSGAGVLPPDDKVLHRTLVRLYETTEEREDQIVLGARTSELVVARDRIALVDDRTGEVWSGRIAAVAHVRDDTTMVLPVGEDRWIGLAYTDRELTRPALDFVAAAHASAGRWGRHLAQAGTAAG